MSLRLASAWMNIDLSDGTVVASEYLVNILLLVLLRVQQSLVDVIIFTTDVEMLSFSVCEVQASSMHVPLAHVLLHMYDVVCIGGFLVTTHVLGNLEEEMSVGSCKVVFTPLADLTIIGDTTHDGGVLRADESKGEDWVLVTMVGQHRFVPWHLVLLFKIPHE